MPVAGGSEHLPRSGADVVEAFAFFLLEFLRLDLADVVVDGVDRCVTSAVVALAVVVVDPSRPLHCFRQSTRDLNRLRFPPCPLYVNSKQSPVDRS